MNELVQQRPVSLADRWAALKRRKTPALVVAILIVVLALATALLWPAKYRSMGTILIEQQELPSDLVPTTITSYADQRIQVISQRVMTTDNLLKIIERYDLYPKIRKRQTREALLERMRKDIHFLMISADVMDPKQGRATKANIAFSISYDSVSAELSARVANELVSLYLDENAKTRKQLSADAENFLEEEADRLNGNIAELEKSLANFKNAHIYTLPDQGITNRELLLRQEEELREIDTQLRTLDQESTYLDAQLAQISPSSQVYTSTGERVLSPADRLKFLRTEYARMSGIYSPDHPDVVRTKREIEGLEAQAGQVDSKNDLSRQLQDAKSNLAELQKRYAPDHPDVIRAQRQVDTLQTAFASAPEVATESATQHPDNPAYIQINAQRQAHQSEKASLLQKREEVSDKLAQLEARLASAPAVERDYDTIARQLDSEQLKYREVRQKQMSAKLAENLEDEQKGERFTLIDPPLVPEEPESPNRLLLLAVGLVLALAGALLTTVVLEQRDQSVRNRADLEHLLSVAPLAVLPQMTTQAEIIQHRRRQRIVLAGAFGSLLLVLALTHIFYRPLDVLWAVTMRKFGGG
jgi:uncharacterized protein involved in exopolysaccharide biosynthesis